MIASRCYQSVANSGGSWMMIAQELLHGDCTMASCHAVTQGLGLKLVSTLDTPRASGVFLISNGFLHVFGGSSVSTGSLEQLMMAELLDLI